LHCLGHFCTAWCPGNALLTYHVGLPWTFFAPRDVQAVLYSGALFFSLF
jgi:hypothetical protein